MALLIGAILLATYFKSIEKGVEKQQGETQNKAADQQEDNLKMDNLENENNTAGKSDVSAEEEIDIEEIDAMEKDFSELEDLVNDPVMENLDSDLESF